MVGPQEDNLSSLCIIDTAVRSRVSVHILEIGDMILEIAMLLIDGGNTARLRCLRCLQKR